MTTLTWIKWIAYGWIALSTFWALAHMGPVEAFRQFVVLSVLFGILYFFVWLMWRFATPHKPSVPTTDAKEFGDR